MGLFGNKENKEDKQNEFRNKLVDNYKFEGMTEKDKETLTKIVLELQVNQSFKDGLAHVGKTEDQMQISYLSVLIEQNWLIINQLAKINKNLENK